MCYGGNRGRPAFPFVAVKSLSLLDSNVPDWACFFDPPRYAAFLAAVQRDLHRRASRGEPR